MKKKIILLIGVIVISSFSIGYITSILINNSTPNNDSNNDVPKFYIAIDDIWFTRYGSLPNYYYDNIRPNMNYLVVGGGEDGTATPDFHVTYIRFDLNNKPTSWTKVEISLYEWNFNKMSDYVVDFRIDLFEGNWNETSGNTEIYWKVEEVDYSLRYKVGFHRTDITDYIKYFNETISMRIYTNHNNRWKGSLYFYSSEWDGLDPEFPYILPENDTYKNYLPQLIYS